MEGLRRRTRQSQNVVVKLGGLGMLFGMFDFHTRETPPSSEELARAYKPYIETCIPAFGPDRGMFESNFPPDGLSSSYAVLWNAFKLLASGYSPEDKAKLFSGTVKRVYRLAEIGLAVVAPFSTDDRHEHNRTGPTPN